MESEQGRTVRRNVSFIKPYLLPDTDVVGCWQEPPDSDTNAAEVAVRQDDTVDDAVDGATSIRPPDPNVDVEPGSRPVRERRRPQYLSDYA